ncbi:hypothetical protein [Tabrizicola sp.]|uniref:hypothetical protein n=1 Tax=Tabrizicola sp. TaxID=2005166 RepID=UPI003F30CB84
MIEGELMEYSERVQAEKGCGMRRWLLLSSYHWTVLLAVLGVAAAVVAWLSFGLINLAMANFEFINRYGLLAVREGGLLQAFWIGAQALIALLLYVLFKAIETELIYRWRGRDH